MGSSKNIVRRRRPRRRAPPRIPIRVYIYIYYTYTYIHIYAYACERRFFIKRNIVARWLSPSILILPSNAISGCLAACLPRSLHLQRKTTRRRTLKRRHASNGVGARVRTFLLASRMSAAEANIYISSIQ